jgi:1,4-alpha-glucan branching enzyme
MKGKKYMAKKIGMKKNTPGRRQTFSFSAPGALSVQLVGDFTHWKESPISLQRESDGVWRTTVELEAGVHYYRFLVDGEWRDDPECVLREPNAFGTQNMMRKVA